MERVKEDYMNIENYLINNKMAINPAKTQLMVMESKSIDDNVSFNIRKDIITNQKAIKILGVTLTADSTFDEHMWKGKKSMVRTLNAKINHIKTIKPFLTTKAMANVGSSMLNSTILYAAAVWGGTTQQNIDRIQAVQTRGARMIVNKSWQRNKIKEHRQVLLDQLNWPNVAQLIKNTTLNITKKAINKQSSDQLNNTFKVKKPNHPRQTTSIRLSHDGKLTRKANVYSAYAIKYYNELPHQLKDPDLTTGQFKTKIKTYCRTQNLLKQH